MNGSFEQPGPDAFEEVMDFMNLVFSQAYSAHDFESLLPKLYRREPDAMRHLLALREGGRLRAMAGFFPGAWQVGETALKTFGVGGVCTHPRDRGAGRMTELIRRAVAERQRDGCDLAYLGGQRQRYQPFGFERCGQLITVTVAERNLRDAPPCPPGFRLEPLSGERPGRVAAAQALHRAQPVHCERAPHDFLTILQTWRNEPHAAIDEAGETRGYLVAGRSPDHLYELVAGDPATARCMVQAWLSDHPGTTVRVHVPSWDAETLQALSAFAEATTVEPAGNWRVFAWDRVLGALLRLRAGREGLAPGETVLSIRGEGSYRLQVEDGRARCQACDTAPDWAGEPLEAMRLLFGPLRPSQVSRLPAGARILDAWCPLPLGWTAPDTV